MSQPINSNPPAAQTATAGTHNVRIQNIQIPLEYETQALFALQERVRQTGK